MRNIIAITAVVLLIIVVGLYFVGKQKASEAPAQTDTSTATTTATDPNSQEGLPRPEDVIDVSTLPPPPDRINVSTSSPTLPANIPTPPPVNIVNPEAGMPTRIDAPDAS